jgi:hypothetical protein
MPPTTVVGAFIPSTESWKHEPFNIKHHQKHRKRNVQQSPYSDW